MEHWVEFTNEMLYASKQELFNDHHVYFQNDQKETHIGMMLEETVSSHGANMHS